MTVYHNPPKHTEKNSALGIFAPLALIALGNRTGRTFRVNDTTQGGNVGGGKRAPITYFSTPARHRLLETATNTPHEISAMTTLSYGLEYPTDGKVIKIHLDRFLTWFKRELKQRYDIDLPYLWRLEFMDFGAPHYHLFMCIDFEALGFKVKTVKRKHTKGYKSEEYQTIPRIERAIRQKWLDIIDTPLPLYGWGGLSDEAYNRKLRAHDIYHAADCMEILREGSAYLVSKEMSHSKEYQNRVPAGFENVGRFWGASRGFKQPLDDYELYEISESKLRALLYLAGWKWLDIFDHLPKYIWGIAPILKRLIRDHGLEKLSLPLEKAKAAIRSVFQRNIKGVRHVDDFDRSVIAAKITNKELHIHRKQRHNTFVNLPPLPRRSLPLAAPNAPPEDKQLSLF